MRVGLIHPAFDSIGGAERVSESMIKGIVNAGYDTRLYTITRAGSFPNVKRSYAKFSFLSTKIELGNIWRTYELYNKANECDVIISATLRVARTKKPTIIYCHSTFEGEVELVKTKPGGKLWLYRKQIHNQMKKQINLLKTAPFKFIANSPYTKNKIKELFNVDSDVIYPPVIVTGVPSNKKRDGIITISRFSPEKNIEFNVNVVKDIHAQYKIFGDNNQPYNLIHYKKILELSKPYNNINLVPNQSNDTLAKNLYESKVYFSSSRETLGMAVVEGIVGGCIPIVPDNTANRDTVPIKELRFKSDDPAAAKEKIELALAGDYDKYLPKLQEHARQFTEESFHQRIIEQIEKVSK